MLGLCPWNNFGGPAQVRFGHGLCGCSITELLRALCSARSGSPTRSSADSAGDPEALAQSRRAPLFLRAQIITTQVTLIGNPLVKFTPTGWRTEKRGQRRVGFAALGPRGSLAVVMPHASSIRNVSVFESILGFPRHFQSVFRFSKNLGRRSTPGSDAQ